MKPHPLGLACPAMMTLAAVPVAGQPAPSLGPASQAPSAAAVLANVRRAVGYDRLRSWGLAFAITERDADGDLHVLDFGTRHGEIRNGREYLFDGRQARQYDARRDMAVPASLRQHEKAAWPLWVRGYWWLSADSGFHVRLLPEQSDAGEIALSLTLPDGVVGATLFIERSTWLPSRLVVPYERGPLTQLYRDYREIDGVLFPETVESNYRQMTRRSLVSARASPTADAFARPALPADHRFNVRRPAALETLDGAPFASGSPGHVYVRGAVDDARQGWWHLDSGADSSIIDEAAAQELGMEVIGTHRSMGADGNVREGTWRRAKSLTIGRLRLENPVFRALDLSANNAPPGERRLGTLGYDLFARAVIEYGNGGRHVRVCDPARYRLPRGFVWQRLEHIDSTPAFRGVAEGHLGLFQLDTGAAGTVDFTKHFHERAGLLRGRQTTRAQVAGSGGSFGVEVGRIAEFRLGGELYRDIEASFRTGGISREGSAGTVGRDVLNRFTMVFDYPNQRLAFVPAGRVGSCR